MTFSKWVEDNWDENNMFPPCLEPQVAVNFLIDYLLGEDWYVVDPLGTQQVNVAAVHDILCKYSRKYRKEYRHVCKLHRKLKNKK